MALYSVSQGGVINAADLDQFFNLLTGVMSDQQVTVTNRVRAQASGASTGSGGYVGATSSGAPSSGTFVTGDFLVSTDGTVWVCTAGGSPGTWRCTDNASMDIVNVTTDPAATYGTYTSETNLSRFALSASLVNNAMYVLAGQCLYAADNSDTEGALRWRHTTTVSGTLLGTVRLNRVPATGAGLHVSWWVPFRAPSTGTLNVYASLQRTSGTGQLTIGGGSYTFASLTRLGTGASAIRTT